jgi:hypothetical protein
VSAFITAAVLLNYIGGSTSSLLSRIIGTWASESLRYLLLTLSSCGALYGWHKRNKGGEAAAVWAGAALFAVLMRQLLAASATLFLNKGSEYISTATDIDILTRWALTALFGCGGVFFLLGWALGNALYAMPAVLYPPGLCSIPLIIAAPSLAVIYPYYHQCIATPIVSVLSALFATLYLYTVSTSSTSGATGRATGRATGSAASVRHQDNHPVQKWRVQGLLLCLFLLISSSQSISECLHCGDKNKNKNAKIKNSKETSPLTGCIWKCPLHDGSVLSIIENSPEENPILRYRVMKLNHAIMGGVWVLPKREAGRPVYTTFHLQAAARLLSKSYSTQENNHQTSETVEIEQQDNQWRSLHIGLGAGTAVSVLQRRGFTTDVVELYQEVIDAAQTHFGLTIDSTKSTTRAGDALKVVPSLENNLYDVVILDVFSGGFPTSPASLYFSEARSKKEDQETARGLSSAAFFEEIKLKMKESFRSDGSNGVLAVNYVGMKDSPELSQLVCTLKKVFSSVRYFKDAEGDDDDADDQEKEVKEKSRKESMNTLGNFVIMATDGDIDGDIVSTTTTTTSSTTTSASTSKARGECTSGLFSAAQKEILKLGEGPLDEMEVDVLSRLAKSELPVAWATQEACENVLSGGGGSDGKKGMMVKSHLALARLHNAAAHWRAMRVQFGDEVWTLL